MAFGSGRSLKTTVASVPLAPGEIYRPNTTISRLWGAFERFGTTYKLNACQMRFAKVFFSGANCYLTGKAGTGKSYLVKCLFTFLSEHSVSVGRTALTGVAAFNIGGSTIHSFAGLGLADEPVEVIIANLATKGKVKARLRAVEVLFIDEVSMAKGDLLNKLDRVLKWARHSPAPFGGVQLIFCGDHLQLPPIFKGDEKHEFSFQCVSWKGATIQPVVLKQIMRQRDGDPLIAVLNDLRIGKTDSLHLLGARIAAVFPNDGIDPVRIFCKNVDVDRYNQERLDLLTTQEKTYEAHDSGMPYHIETFNKHCPAAEVLILKVGAQVMLLANLDTEGGLINGSVGTVKAFTPEGVSVRFKTGTAIVDRARWEHKEQEAGSDGVIKLKVVATRSQIPLRVCYAVTVHKVQGQTLDRAIVDLSEAFGTSMVYVALSRVRDLESLSIAGEIPTKAIKVNQACIDFYRAAEELDIL